MAADSVGFVRMNVRSPFAMVSVISSVGPSRLIVRARLERTADVAAMFGSIEKPAAS